MSDNQIKHDNQIKGAIYGLLIGDAVGVPYEFNPPDHIPEFNAIDMQPPVGFKRSHANVPIGTWSDDGSQALCLLASLLARHKLDADDLMQRFVRWYDEGYMAVDNHVFDIGIQTAQALQNYIRTHDVMLAAPSHERANGNGSLMRTLPLALWHTGSDNDLIADAYLQSHVTHAHLRSKICCALYCLWARAILNGQSIHQGWHHAIDTLYDIYAQRPETGELEQLDFFIRPRDIEQVNGSGYVVDCLKSAFVAAQESSYKNVIKKAIRLGNDTDTTACVAGGIAGLYYGFDAIPSRWISQLRDKSTVDALIEQLL